MIRKFLGLSLLTISVMCAMDKKELEDAHVKHDKAVAHAAKIISRANSLAALACRQGVEWGPIAQTKSIMSPPSDR